MSHAPKQRALEAYVCDLLSPAGSARLQRHLTQCEVCSESLAAVRAYENLRKEAGAGDVPLLEWERLSAALEADARPQGTPPRLHERRGKVLALTWPLLAVAATLVIAWLGMSNAPTVQVGPRAAESVSAVAAAERVGHVSLVAGSVELLLNGAPVPVTLATEIREGSTLITGPEAQVHVVLAEGTGFALGPDTRMNIRRLREDATLLELSQGDITNQVHKLSSRERYEIGTRDVSIRVRGTRFSVQRREALRVTVYEGKVEVARGDKVLALLSPGESYESPKPASPRPQQPEPHIHRIEGLPAEFGALQLPPMPELRAWIIADARLSSQGQLALRLPMGSTKLGFEDLRGHIRSVQLDLREAVTALEPAALAKLLAPKEPRVGYLAPQEISKVIKGGVEPLRRCYERGLRTRPDLAGKLILAMRVGPDGRVVQVEPKGNTELPHDVERCISQEARRLVFPKPEGGGAVAFEVPLNLKSSR